MVIIRSAVQAWMKIVARYGTRQERRTLEEGLAERNREKGNC